MSSILDALNKLEQEKAQAEQEEIDRDIDPQQAVRELVGGLASPGRTVRLTPAALVVGGLLFMGGMIAISVGVTVAILGGDRPAPEPETAPVAAETSAIPEPTPLAAEPEPEPEFVAAVVPPASYQSEPKTVPAKPPAAGSTEAPVVETRVASVAPVAAQSEPAPASETAPPDTQAVPAQAPVEPAVQAPAPVAREVDADPEPVVEEPALAVARPAPAPAPFLEPEPEPEPQPERSPVVTDIRKLPPLTLAVQRRYGAEPILINMISPASANRPYAYAIINRIKVTVGDYIGGSRLKLVDVENHGIAVEAGSDRYYVAF